MDPIDDLTNYKFGVFYFNKQDERTVVPKRTRYMGWTFNFARLESYLMLVIIGLVIYVISLLK